MTVDEVRARLAGHWDELRAMGVVSLRIFGSTARGEAGPGSDVDLLVELNPAQQITLLEVARLKGALEDLLGTSVDLAEPHVVQARGCVEILEEAVDAA